MARCRTSTGRRRIQIRRIQDEMARQVCFSKRRTGLFNKAIELAVMCGVELAAVVISPGNKAFTFGHPSVEDILERFAPTGAAAAGGGGAGAGAGAGGELAELNRQYRELRARLDAAEKAQKERAEAALAKERAAPNPVAAWLDANVRDLGEAELMAFEAALARVQVAVAARADKEVQNARNYGRAFAATSNNNQLQPTPQMFLPNNNQVQPTPQQFLPNNNQVQPMPQMFLPKNNQVQLQPTPQQFLPNNNYQVQLTPQQFLPNNNYRVQPTRQQFLPNNNQVQPTPQQFLPNNNQVQPTPQQFLDDNGVGHDQSGGGSSSSSANNDVSEIQMLLMPPQPGFNGAGLEMMMMEQGLGFPGPN